MAIKKTTVRLSEILADKNMNLSAEYWINKKNKQKNDRTKSKNKS